MENTTRMRKPVLAASITVLLSLLGSNAAALSLGRLTVQSTLGQPLRAEIDVPEINPEEAESLKGSVASAAAFKAAGLEFNPAISNVQVTLQRRPDGKMFLKLSGERVVNDPFVDLILEANWSSGRILRDYTLLFDPPSLRDVAAPTAPQVAAAPAAASPTPSARPNAPAVARELPSPVSRPQRAATPVAAASPADKPAATTAKQVTVRPGDSASKIAGAHKAASVSLDQMMVALLRTNPDAFAGNNINRLKSGAVLDLPSSDQALETSRDAATQTVLAQSKDFNDFRHQLAGVAPSTVPATAGRQASGKVQALVEDKKTAVATPDKLTLSKAAAQSKAAEDKISAEREAKDAAARTAELSRNVAELNKLKAGTAPLQVAPTSAAPAPVVPVAPTPEVKPPVAVVAPLAAVASAPEPTPTPVQATASRPVAPNPVARAPVPAQEPGFLDGLIENPLIPGGALVIAGLLAGFAVYRSRRGKRGATGDSSFLDSHLQPDSFFGASGGEQVDTSNDGVATGGSSMIYSPSQLDASGEVDPVAEADVYLAYGRDQQAEDILKDALQTTPSRLAIHAKLADIYAKRADTMAFNAIAGSAHTVSQGQGAEWEHIRDLGRELDRDNALYQLDGAGPVAPEPVPGPATADSKPTVPADLDFDLDLDVPSASTNDDDEHNVMGVLHGSDEASGPAALYEVPPAAQTVTPIYPTVADHGNTHDVAVSVPVIAPAAPTIAPEPAKSEFPEPAAPLKIKSHTAISSQPQAAPEMLSFDLGALSLDLDSGEPATVPHEEADTDHLDPLATKLALAKEFQSIGDNDGAHALAEEVFTLASGQLRADAKRFLSELGFAQSGFAQSTF